MTFADPALTVVDRNQMSDFHFGFDRPAPLELPPWTSGFLFLLSHDFDSGSGAVVNVLEGLQDMRVYDNRRSSGLLSLWECANHDIFSPGCLESISCSVHRRNTTLTTMTRMF